MEQEIFSNEYPIGGEVEPYDLERDKELIENNNK